MLKVQSTYFCGCRLYGVQAMILLLRDVCSDLSWMLQGTHRHSHSQPQQQQQQQKQQRRQGDHIAYAKQKIRLALPTDIDRVSETERNKREGKKGNTQR